MFDSTYCSFSSVERVAGNFAVDNETGANISLKLGGDCLNGESCFIPGTVQCPFGHHSVKSVVAFALSKWSTFFSGDSLQILTYSDLFFFVS